MMSDSDHDILEELVDQHSLATVLEALATICYGKAAHLRENWQDASSALEWDRAARYLDGKASVAKAIEAVS